MPRRQTEIIPGQRFVARGTHPQIWEVIGFREAPGEPNLHVRLARYGRPSDLKTISASALLDRRFFDLVSTPAQAPKHRPGRTVRESIRRGRLRLRGLRATVDG